MKNILMNSFIVGVFALLTSSVFADLVWVDLVNGVFPETTAWAGKDADGQQLAPCKAKATATKANNKQIDVIGKTGPGLKDCRFEWDTKIGNSTQFQVLVYGNWYTMKGSMLPPNMIEAGRDLDGKVLGICRAIVDFRGKRVTVIGKTGPGLGDCRYEFDTKIGQTTVFDVLTK